MWSYLELALLFTEYTLTSSSAQLANSENTIGNALIGQEPSTQTFQIYRGSKPISSSVWRKWS